MIPRDLHFADPAAFLYLLLVMPLMGVVFWSLRSNSAALSKLVQPSLLPYISIEPHALSKTLKMLLGLAGWIFIVLALMRPQGNEQYLQSLPSDPKRGAISSLNVLFLMDVSQSMGVADTRNHFSRLDTATSIGDQLLHLMPVDQTALLSFTDRLNPIIPLTYDKLFLRIALRELELNEGQSYGTDYLKLLEDLKKELDHSDLKPSAIVLFSDGGDNELELLAGEAQKQALEKISNEAKKIAVPIFTVGIGSAEGGAVPQVLLNGQPVISKLQEGPLQAISAATKGRYFSGADLTSSQIARQLNEALIHVRRFTTAVEAHPRSFSDYFQIPLLIGILALLFSWWMPNFRHQIWLLAFIPLTLQANLGDQLYASGRFKEAAEWYESQLNDSYPIWLQDKLYYNLGTSLIAANETKEGLIAFLNISPESYAYPNFQKNLLHNLSWAANKELKEKEISPLNVIFFNLHLLASSSELNPKRLQAILRSLEKQRDALLKGAAASLHQIEDNQSAASQKALGESALQVALYQLQKMSNEPKEFLEYLLMLLAQFRQNEALNLSSDISLDTEARRFYAVTTKHQEILFDKGGCPCHPWDQVLPLFAEGLAYANAKNLTAAYVSWSNALKLLETLPEKPSQPQEEALQRQRWNELQEMEKQDRPERSQILNKGEGAVW